jgi:hypothetical protein
MSRPRIFPAIAALSAALLSLAGCSSAQSDWSQYIQLIRGNYRGSAQRITLEQAAAIPYASLGYRIDDGGQGLLVLATDTGGTRLWTARSRVVMVTRDGRLVRTVGLPHDRAAMTAQKNTVLAPPGQALKGAFRSDRIMDIPSIGTYSIPINCLTTARGREIITILGTALPTRRIEETCRSNNPRWSFTDIYWVDMESGFPWRSVQHLAPSKGKVQIDILRPPE